VPCNFVAFIESDLRDLALRRSGSRPWHGANARNDEEAVMTGVSNEPGRPDLEVHYRQATEGDTHAIAALHADSWRRHYRGALLDAYLDGDVFADRLEVWRHRLTPPVGADYTVCAVSSSELLGFAHTIFDRNPKWGALLENLHVRSDLKARGIGTQLLSASAVELARRRALGGLYLWVLQQNTAAQSFYEARGATCVESAPSGPLPGGGQALSYRYFWPDPSRLIVEG
jgi:GNAT superfamily N-acetyltransferase